MIRQNRKHIDYFFVSNSLVVRISRFLSMNKCIVMFPYKKMWNREFEFACLQTDVYQVSYANRTCCLFFLGEEVDTISLRNGTSINNSEPTSIELPVLIHK